MRNLFAEFLDLLPREVKLVGVVESVSDGQPVVALSGGGKVKARGTAAVGDRVYVRGGVVEGPAPELPSFTTEV